MQPGERLAIRGHERVRSGCRGLTVGCGWAHIRRYVIDTSAHRTHVDRPSYSWRARMVHGDLVYGEVEVPSTWSGKWHRAVLILGCQAGAWGAAAACVLEGAGPAPESREYSWYSCTTTRSRTTLTSSAAQHAPGGGPLRIETIRLIAATSAQCSSGAPPDVTDTRLYSCRERVVPLYVSLLSAVLYR